MPICSCRAAVSLLLEFDQLCWTDKARSRALAVASPSGYVGIFKLRRVDEIQREIDRWNPLENGSFRPSDEVWCAQYTTAYVLTFPATLHSSPRQCHDDDFLA